MTAIKPVYNLVTTLFVYAYTMRLRRGWCCKGLWKKKKTHCINLVISFVL